LFFKQKIVSLKKNSRNKSKKFNMVLDELIKTLIDIRDEYQAGDFDVEIEVGTDLSTGLPIRETIDENKFGINTVYKKLTL
jgi:hypothetical protein